MSMLKETLQKFIENKPEFLNILGFEDCSFDEHNEIYTCIFNPPISLTHSNGTIVQGGFVAGMLDSAMAQYILNLHEFKVNPLSLDLDIKYLLPCRPGRVEAKAKILKMGRSIAFTTAELFQDGNLIATASSTNKLIRYEWFTSCIFFIYNF